MTPDLSIISGTWRRLPMLQKMVASVRASINPGLTYELILVGVAGDDDTLAWCRAQRDVRLIVQPGLEGAISAFCEGGHAAQGRHIVFLNDDLVVVGDTLTRAVAFMDTHPDVGIAAMYTDRQGGWKVAGMHARLADGKPTILPYNGCSIMRSWIGKCLDFWRLPGAKTYGGDNGLVAKIIQAGWQAVCLPTECGVKETIPDDELNRINNHRPEVTKDHPDTQAYKAVYPNGPQIRVGKAFDAPADARPPMRILYGPIYEENHKVQHEQKNGLRRALMRLGPVLEVDFLAHGPDSILRAAADWQPQFIFLQLQYPEPFTPEHMQKLRRFLPNSTIVSWSGDVYDMTQHPQHAAANIALLRQVNLHTVVNETAMYNFIAAGVNCRYLQLGFEPEGVGHDPTPDTPRHDVVFLGNGYSANRHRFGDFLKTLSCRLGVYGLWWPMLDAHAPTLYDFRAGCRLYRAARLAVGDSEWATTARGFVSNRAYQAMAAGGCLMLQQTFDGTELVGLEDGVHWVLWRDYEDLREKIDYYLSHEDEQARIAAAGQVEVLTNHSFDKRVQELLAMLRAPKQRVDPMNGDPTLARFHEVQRG